MTAPDAGLAAARSWLAWQRTELSALALAGLLLKLGLSRRDPVELAAAAAVFVDAALLWLGRATRRRDPRAVMRRWLLRGASVLAILAAGLVAFSFG